MIEREKKQQMTLHIKCILFFIRQNLDTTSIITGAQTLMVRLQQIIHLLLFMTIHKTDKHRNYMAKLTHNTL